MAMLFARFATIPAEPCLVHAKLLRQSFFSAPPKVTCDPLNHGECADQDDGDLAAGQKTAVQTENDLSASSFIAITSNSGNMIPVICSNTAMLVRNGNNHCNAGTEYIEAVDHLRRVRTTGR